MSTSLAHIALLTLSLGLALLGCQGAATLPPAATDSPPPRDLPSVRPLESGGQAVTALFHVQLDPASLTATVSPQSLRLASAQPPQAISYDLDIENFQNAQSFRVVGVEVESEGGLRLHWTHAHPFPAPDFAQPISGINRADLGYTGRLLVLPNGGAETSAFGGENTLNPRLVREADGYLTPGDLLAQALPGSQNTLAYELLVDDAADPFGSYDPASGGWQRSNIGIDQLGWRGYDYLHGGQTTSGSLLLDGPELSATGNDFDVAILIKYTDPRGVGGRNLRLPPATADVTQFAYRLPFAALDCAKIDNPLGVITLLSDAGSSADLELRVRDWDAGAVASSDADLSDEPDVSKVQPGAPGVPLVEVDSGVFGAGLIPLSGISGSGLPGTEMRFTGTLLNPGGLAPGDYLLLARVTDDEDLLDDSAYHFGVDPETVLPTRTPLREITYQVLPIRIALPPPVILSVTPTGSVGIPRDTVEFTATTQNLVDSLAWTFDPFLADPPSSAETSPEVALLAPGTFTGSVVATGPGGTSAPFPFAVTIDMPPLPTVESIAPNIVALGETVQFAAIVTGNPDAYVWDFGLGAQPRFPEGPLPEVVPTALGVFEGVLILRNEAGFSEPFRFTYRVLDPVQVSFTKTIVPDSDLTELTLMPSDAGVCIAGFSPGGATQILAVPAGEASTPESWVAYELEPTNTDGVRQDMAGTIHNGRPVLLYFSDNGGNVLRIAHALVDVPLSASDWRIYNLFGFGTDPAVSTFASLLSFNGRLAAVFRAKTTGDLRFLRANVAEPTSFADWTVHVIDASTSVTHNTDLASVAGRLSVAYQDGSLGFIKYARALVTEPGQTSDWNLSGITGLGSAQQVALEGVLERAICINHPPPFAFVDSLRVAVAGVSDPAGFDWEVFPFSEVGNVIGSYDTAMINGRLLVAVELSDASVVDVYLSDVPLPNSFEDFQGTLVTFEGGAFTNVGVFQDDVCLTYRRVDELTEFAF